MNRNFFKKLFHLIVLLSAVLNCNYAAARLLNTPDNETNQYRSSDHPNRSEDIYVASDNNVKQFFYVLGSALNKPVIVSNEAAKKRISGNFDLSHPDELLKTVAIRTGLIWYDDGSSIYVYDSNEVQSSVVKLSFAPYDRLVAFLRSSGLYDNRFPLRSDGQSGSFYVSGPPVYVELVSAAAKYIDTTYSRTETGEVSIRVIKLKNTFVNDRTYIQRDTPVTIAGVATVLNKLLNNLRVGVPIGAAKITVDNDTQRAMQAATADQTGLYPQLPLFNSAPSQSAYSDASSSREDTVNIVAYSDTNSLLIQGSPRQVSFVEDLVQAMDIAKQQIQLSLWIIDISKDQVDKLGVRWEGALTLGNTGVTVNSSTLTPSNSAHFLADVNAQVQRGNAQIVSRPEILTQENVPALFDNNTSFYTKLVGERTASLEKVTYGTMISVLPRLTQDRREIEMILNIQDGGTPLGSNGQTAFVDNLPIVNNTQISTEARVPAGYGLLVGGYSRDEDTRHNVGVPLLRDIPLLGRAFDYNYVTRKKMVRMFLIQPRLLTSGETWQGRSNDNPVLGYGSAQEALTLKSTVSMLRDNMKNSDGNE
ncbi:type III secretion system outer membrane ring subunit SctC [Erwinia tracheiphila]|uniref:Type 3 secretion system secretin n=1 Tax=Erwinia tracheiphila TaxID=65700 RepID=A0A345CW28_9GAMM|nr:type III secretion system outer membrane ring subunit SctC [Erwinia tracheiphila]AXF77645.1 EscC/YscC/HrcC family type III secretion system outer membrane ring protein [Erwinia tracheiphila]UIA83668.1 type III secretion system outer membrane ring subunit SctC [Erwinia tracheiphila]UIA92250.1 type III secretion system outer membrane ring subunit SctC [Erwinia tracheiphila]